MTRQLLRVTHIKYGDVLEHAQPRPLPHTENSKGIRTPGASRVQKPVSFPMEQTAENKNKERWREHSVDKESVF